MDISTPLRNLVDEFRAMQYDDELPDDFVQFMKCTIENAEMKAAQFKHEDCIESVNFSFSFQAQLQRTMFTGRCN